MFIQSVNWGGEGSDVNYEEFGAGCAASRGEAPKSIKRTGRARHLALHCTHGTLFSV